MSEQDLPEIELERDNLYREESYTDRRVGTLQRLVPITADGEEDPDRDVVFTGQAQLMTPMGALPLSFEIPATTFQEALDGYSAAARQAMEQTVQELQEMQREQAGGLVMPGQGGGGGMGGMPGGGQGGGGFGGLQMP